MSKSEDPNSNYPNETDYPPTFDANEQLKRIQAQKAKRLEYHEPTVAKETEVYVPSKDDIDANGHKETDPSETIPEDISGDDYPFTESHKQFSEAERKKKAGSDVVKEINFPAQ
jgi:hypothetical protein